MFLLHDTYHAAIGKTVIGAYTTFRKATDAAKVWVDTVDGRSDFESSGRMASWLTITEMPEPDVDAVVAVANNRDVYQKYWRIAMNGAIMQGKQCYSYTPDRESSEHDYGWDTSSEE
jgi:hypothetical protein